ncbi:flagellar biosynthesis protein FliQ [soil metagenome]
MNSQSVLTLGMDAMQTTLLVAAPLLLVALVVGLLVSVFQAATQINEQTMSFIPKLVSVLVTLTIGGPWMISIITDFMRRVFEGIPGAVG